MVLYVLFEGENSFLFLYFTWFLLSLYKCVRSFYRALYTGFMKITTVEITNDNFFPGETVSVKIIAIYECKSILTTFKLNRLLSVE